jgi:hypothetical protein
VTIDDILSAIEAREKDATPGPWVHDVNELVDEPNVYAHYVCDKHGDPIAESMKSMNDFSDDYEFIAHARTDVPRLVKALRKAVATIEYFGMHACEVDIQSILNGSEQ